MANLNEFKALNEVELATVEGGSKQLGDAVLSGLAGAIDGVLYCANATGGLLPPNLYLACAGAGAAVGIFLPH